MTTVLVTGSAGFIGKHLVLALRQRPETTVMEYDVGCSEAELEQGLSRADVIFHLAGVNRPQDPGEFQACNTDFFRDICHRLRQLQRSPGIVLSSSIQAELQNPYGISKRAAEGVLRDYSERARAGAVIFRLKNVFGKWCRPNYNSVTATFCHNLAHGQPISISDPNRELELVYIDDVVASFMAVLDHPPIMGTCESREPARSFKITLGELADKVRSFRESRTTLRLPSFQDDFTRCLYATYLSYLEPAEFGYPLDIKTDNRGELAEFIKSAHFGQIFVSRTKPGITRGNHYHHTKAEKFLVVQGEAVIRLRSIQPTLNSQVLEHRVSGLDFRVVDIPPGFTHSIENVGNSEMVVLFWSSEIFDRSRPDTCFEAVLR